LPFFFFRERTGVNNEHALIVVQHEYHLQQPIALTSTPNQPFIVFDSSRIGFGGVQNHAFGLRWANSMCANVLDIPFVPAKFHERVTLRYPP